MKTAQLRERQKEISQQLGGENAKISNLLREVLEGVVEEEKALERLNEVYKERLTIREKLILIGNIIKLRRKEIYKKVSWIKRFELRINFKTQYKEEYDLYINHKFLTTRFRHLVEKMQQVKKVYGISTLEGETSELLVQDCVYSHKL